MFNLIMTIILIVIWLLTIGNAYKKGYEKDDYNGFKRYHNFQICIDCKNHNTSCPNYHGYCKWEN